MEFLAEDFSLTLEKLKSKLHRFNTADLMKSTQQYGTGKTKGILKVILRTALQHA